MQNKDLGLVGNPREREPPILRNIKTLQVEIIHPHKHVTPTNVRKRPPLSVATSHFFQFPQPQQFGHRQLPAPAACDPNRPASIAGGDHLFAAAGGGLPLLGGPFGSKTSICFSKKNDSLILKGIQGIQHYWKYFSLSWGP